MRRFLNRLIHKTYIVYTDGYKERKLYINPFIYVAVGVLILIGGYLLY